MLKGSNIGKALINDYFCYTSSARSISTSRVYDACSDITVIVIPKLNKDHTVVKGWRSIVSSNTASKLVHKQVSKMLQENTLLVYHLQYRSRTGRSAIDTLMLIVAKGEHGCKSSLQLEVSLFGTDIVSVFIR